MPPQLLRTMAQQPQPTVHAISKPVAVLSSSAMAVFYVAILYAPTVLLRLPPPTSFKSFMIRRFICAAISSALSLLAASFLLRAAGEDSHVHGAFGIRLDHIWQAAVYPLFLTSLMYAGSFLLKALLFVDSLEVHLMQGDLSIFDHIKNMIEMFITWMFSMVSNVGAWRNYVVAPLTEELVFRACMIPLLFCGGFSTYTVVFVCPIFFSLAHLNHLLELYIQQNISLLKASKIVGFQLGYTVIFGSYAAFLFVRTGHLVSPLIAHIFCNYMGFPVMFSRRAGTITLAFVAGLLGFFWLLFPVTSPQLYNYRIDNCKCWHRYCHWT